MTVRFNSNADILERAVIDALDQVAEWVLSDVVEKQVIPFDVGTMQNTATFVNRDKLEDGEVTIVTSTPYARRLYFHPEYNFQTNNNPNAKGKWFEDWTDGGIYASKVRRNYELLIKRLGSV